MNDELEKFKHAGCGPLKFQSVAELDRAITKYLRDCDPHWVHKQNWVLKRKKNGSLFKDSNGQNVYIKLRVRRPTEPQPYIIAGLAVALGVSRQTILN